MTSYAKYINEQQNSDCSITETIIHFLAIKTHQASNNVEKSFFYPKNIVIPPTIHIHKNFHTKTCGNKSDPKL